MITELLKLMTLNGMSPAIVEEASPTVTYIGFLNPLIDKTNNTDAELSPLAIKKIEINGSITTTKWVGGSANPTFATKWSDRATATYLF